MNRVAVTGLGAICGVGNNLNSVWEGLVAGKSGVSLIEQINTDPIATKFGGEVKNFELSEDILEAKEQKRYDRFLHLALESADQAIKDSNGLKESYPVEKIGCIFGVGIGGFPYIENNHNVFLEKGARRISPFFIPGVIPNMASGLISLKFGLKGANYIISSACASSAHALTAAATEIMLGRLDSVVTGGSESALSYLGISGFNVMKALSKKNDSPQTASRPFDQDRDGFVIGEGSGAIILENWDKAQARGAKIYAEVVGHGLTSDAYHITAPDADGLGASACMKMAIESAKISKEDIGYINAHGTSTPLGDLAETKAIKKTFGEHAYDLNVSSTKSMTGHLLGAAGGIESVVCIKALYEGIIPPTINLENPGEDCDLNYTALKAEKRDIHYALNNSFGFGGTNSSLIFKKV